MQVADLTDLMTADLTGEKEELISAKRANLAYFFKEYMTK
jgi:hypothetical protein